MTKNIIISFKHKVDEKLKLTANDKMFEKLKEELNELRGHKKQNLENNANLTDNEKKNL